MSKLTRRFWIFSLILILFGLCYQFWRPLSTHVVALVENFLPYNRGVDTYDFISTEIEDLCLSGASLDNLSTKTPIPNTVHYVVGLHDAELSFVAYLSILTALKSLNPEVVKLHHTENLNISNEYIQILLQDKRVKLVLHAASMVTSEMKLSSHFAHLADVLRLKVLYAEGGIYLDADVYILQSFDTLRNSSRDVVLGYEGGNRGGLCNAVIIARAGAAFIDRWIASYTDFSAGEWNTHSVILPKEMSEKHPNEVCTLSPQAFFWPTWTRRHLKWMHKPLSQEEAIGVQEILDTNRGSYFDGQLAYHSWNQLAWKPYLSKLTEEIIKRDDTRFNLIIRRFL